MLSEKYGVILALLFLRAHTKPTWSQNQRAYHKNASTFPNRKKTE
jgi:hypothetical protein